MRRPKVYAGLYHDTYTDEKGKEFAYEDVIAGVWQKGTFKATSFPDCGTFDISKTDFKKKVTHVCEIPLVSNP